MRTDFLLEEFEVLTKTPQDTAILETAILEMAVRGLLVPQDPHDEPASESLMRIKAERDDTLREHKVREVEHLPPLDADDVPYSLPRGWIWVRLSEVVLINPRNEVEDDIEASFVPMNLIPTKYGDEPSFEARLWGEIKSGYTHFRENDVVLAKITPCFENRKSVVMRGLVNGVGAGTTELYVFRGNPKHILPGYVLIFLKTSSFVKGGKARMTGTAGQQRVPKSYVHAISFPFPPPAEQKRIVARVDELLAQTRALAAQLDEADKALVPAAQASFHALADARDKAVQCEAWQRISDSFGALTSDPRTLDALKQMVLQLAVQGKLVTQDPNDKPASVLLERLRIKKRQLVEKRRMPKSREMLSISLDEIPYELPPGWAWARLGRLTEKLGSGSTPRGGRNVYQDHGIKFIRSQNVWNDGLRLNDVAFISEKINEKMSATMVNPKDILLNITGASIGRSALVPDDFDVGNVSQHVSIIRLVDPSMREFIHLCLISPVVQRMIWGVQVGISRPGLSKKRLEEFVIAIPPLAEQKRIVVKVKSLLALIDALSAEVVAAEDVRGRLLGAVVNGD